MQLQRKLIDVGLGAAKKKTQKLHRAFSVENVVEDRFCRSDKFSPRVK